MKNIFYIILVLTFFNCKSAKQNAGNKEKKTIDYIELEKGICFGKCKAYKIIINRNGEARYSGKLNVSKTGEYKKNISHEEINDLWKVIEEADLFKLKDQYDFDAEDTQPVLLRYSQSEKIKEIHYKLMSPKVLKTIENRLEQIAESEGWEKL